MKIILDVLEVKAFTHIEIMLRMMMVNVLAMKKLQYYFLHSLCKIFLILFLSDEGNPHTG